MVVAKGEEKGVSRSVAFLVRLSVALCRNGKKENKNECDSAHKDVSIATDRIGRAVY
jgi:CDGSH-type Zn-finger protein